MSKFTITFKTPDVAEEAAREEAQRRFDTNIDDIDEDEIDDFLEKESDKISDFLDKFMKYGEYISIEFDTDNNTAIVLKV